MSRIADAFAALRRRGDAALIPFLMAGDPDLDATLQLVRAAADNGADLLELGMPFSDPTADGPVLQRSARRALQRGVSLPRVFELVQELRRGASIPVILFGYYNPIFHYGPQRFAADAKAAGVDGCLVVDLPPEEADELQRWMNAERLDMIFLLAPTSGPERVKRVLKRARGFLYYVSLTGVTGPRATLPENVAPRVAALRRSTKLPIGVGFGISSPEQAATVSVFADAVIVGSAVMKVVEDHLQDGRSVERVGTFVRRMKQAMRKGEEAQRVAT